MKTNHLRMMQFYNVDSTEGLIDALSNHVDSLQQAAIDRIMPWEDTFPPTLLRKYLKDLDLQNDDTMHFYAKDWQVAYTAGCNDTRTAMTRNFEEKLKKQFEQGEVEKCPNCGTIFEFKRPHP